MNDNLHFDPNSDFDFTSSSEDEAVSVDTAILLAEAMLESAVGKAGLSEISTREAFCLVVLVPSADWVQPIDDFLREVGDWASRFTRTSKPKGRDTTADYFVDVLAAGRRLYAVAPTLSHLPDAIITAADLTVSLRPPTPVMLASVIAAVTGNPPVDVPPSLGAGLTYSEIASAIRRTATAGECVDRLKKVTEKKRSIALVPGDVPLIEDLFGYGAAKIWAMNLIADLDEVRQGNLAMNDVAARIVLAGPPGTGKTTFARSLARSAGLPLVATSVANWFGNTGGYLDEVIKEIDTVFNSASALGNAVVLIDEIDAVPDRASADSRNRDYWAPVVSHLLTLLDGACASTSSLVVIGATNHPGRLDAALVRPGRLNRIITLDPPTEADLARIFRQHLGSDLADMDLSAVASITLGATGAMVAEWVKSAQRVARTAKRPMTMSDLATVVAPPDDRPPKEIYRASVHEAGHAVAAHVLETGRVVSVSIIGRGLTGGNTAIQVSSHLATRDDVERSVVQALCGRAAEEVILGSPGAGAGGHVGSDLAFATHHVGMLHLSVGLGDCLSFRADPEAVLTTLSINPRLAEVVEGHLRVLYDQALEVVRANVGAINAVADRLVADRHLDGGKFLEIVKHHRTGTRAKEPHHG